jgi:hypothetical protein
VLVLALAPDGGFITALGGMAAAFVATFAQICHGIACLG